MREEKRKVAVIGLRGIPAQYGGTETFIEELTKRLKNRFLFYVMHEDSKFYEDTYNGIVRIHAPAIESKSTSIPSINDFITTLYLISKYTDIDVFYFLGPDSSIAAVIPRLGGKRIMINPDGIEWKRLIKRSYFAPFYSFPVYFLTMVYMYLMELLSCRVSDVVVADSLGIREHLKRHSPRKIVYIAYGARDLIHTNSPEKEGEILEGYGLKPKSYYLTVARIVAENNIHMEIEGFKKVDSRKLLVVVGNFNERDPYTKHLYKLKGDREDIIFIEPIYDKEILGVLRKNCFAYIHAYEVGGTNPSLLEQMLFRRPILAYDVPFHREVLQEGGIYFRDADDLASKMEMLERGEFDLKTIKKMQIKRIKRQYNWEKVAEEYERLFERIAEFRL
jgi:glycosyltransferase involved in cell wall biosynthesis